MVRSYQLNLSVLSFVSLFVGMFLVYSLVSLHATSRRHELAILRSVGASSRLIFLLFLTEGAFFGCVGWLLALACIFGVFIAHGGNIHVILHALPFELAYGDGACIDAAE